MSGRRAVLFGLIVTHGALAAALREAAARIAGDVTQLEIASNDALSVEGLHACVREAVDRLDQGDGGIIFTDLAGGSCAVACRMVLQAHPKVRLVTGINLPMLVDFVLRRGDLDLDALVVRLLQRGQSSIQELGGA
jgi:mannose/fructose-specific phosphotransferase system component IIA